jgi:hypothetical protein
MIKKYKKLKFIQDPRGLINAENEYIVKVNRESQNRKNKKKQPITKKSLDALEIYLDPTPLSPEEKEDLQKRMSNVIRKQKIVALLEELNVDLLPSKEKSELLAVFKMTLSKTQKITNGKSVSRKTGKNKYKQISSTKNIAAEPKVKYGKKKKK